MADPTTNLNIALVKQSQAQKEVTVNAAIVKLDALFNRGAIDKDLNTPPGSPAEGDLYIVAASATGDWVGRDLEIAYYEQVWRFITPNEGFVIWVNDENALYGFDGAAWVKVVEATETPQFTRIGVGTAADGTHLINVSGVSVLFSNGAGGFTQQMNKNSAGDDLKLLFQQGFSTRAELGLIADNDFRLKVSPDGSQFFDAWVIDRLNGNTNFVQQANISGHSPINHKNYVINGDCKVAQRASYTLVKDAYDFGQVDRFEGMATGTLVSAGTLVHSAFSGKDYIKFEQVTLTGTGQLFLRTRIEAQDAEIFNSQQASFSASVFHDLGSDLNYTITVRKANAADDFSATTDISNSGTIAVSDSSETVIKFQDITMGTCENGIEIEIKIDTGAITTKDFLLRKFQLELGSIATQFVTEPIADTLRKCKRYYQALGKGINGAFSSGSEIDTAFLYPVEMRAVPTGTLLNATPSINHTGVGGKTGVASAIAGGGTSYSVDGAYVRINGFSGGTGGNPVFITSDNVIGLGSEL